MLNYSSVSAELIEEIKTQALAEFEQLSKIYRPTFQTRKICDYLKNRIKQLRPNIDVYEDAYRANLIDDIYNPKLSSGNLWFDLPANDPSLKNNAPIILQAHMDMVCTYEDEQARERMKENGVDLEYHNNGTLTSRDHKTSLGADNGIGIAIMLAIIRNDNFKHGPIRFIFTADEEVGMSGAGYIGLTKQGEKGMPVQGINYLINNDNAFDGEMLVSTAGYIGCSYFLPTDPDTQPLPSGSNVYTLDVSGFSGGHSGDWIAKHANAIDLAADIMKDVNKTEDFRLIEFLSPDSDHQNVVHTHAVVTFASSLSINDIKQIADARLQETVAKYPEETNGKVTVEPAKLPSNIEIRPYSHEICSKILNLMTKIQTGVMSWKDQSIEWVETSGNIGPVWLTLEKEEKEGKTLWHSPSFELQTGFRSCNNDHINQLAAESKQLALDVLGHNDLDYYKLKNVFYGWPGNTDETFVNVAKSAYEKRGTKWTARNLHGYLEVGWFKNFNPNLNILSIGAEIHDMHSSKETLYTETLNGVIGVTLDCISFMKYAEKK